jgi:hypothetical protein
MKQKGTFLLLLSIITVHKVFDQNANLLDDAYDKRIIKFLEEFEWYIEALKNQRAKGTPY